MKFRNLFFVIGFFAMVIGFYDQVAASEKNYIIGPEDILEIRVWENPQLSVVVSVRPDGKITIPLIGDVNANIETLALKKSLEEKLLNYVKDPIVTVIVQSINSFKVYVIGKGVTAQVVTLKKNTRLMQLLAQIGPLNNANLDEAYILRKNERLKINFNQLIIKGDPTHDIALMPDDNIFIPDNFEQRIQIVGAVKKPQTIFYREGLNIVDAFLSVDGFTDYAKLNNISVYRKEGNSTKEIAVKYKDLVNKGEIRNNINLMPGDLIIVKESFF